MTTGATEATGLDKKPTFEKPVIEPVKTPAQYAGMAEMLKTVKAYRDRVEAFFAPHKQRAHAAWQGLVDEEKAALQPALETEAAIKRELVAYRSAQEAIRQAEQRRLEEEARKLEEQRRLDEAAALEREAARTGNEDLRKQAQQLVDEPVETPSVQLERAAYVPHVSGLSFRETWSGKVTDLKKLIKWVAKHPEHTNLLQVNQTALNNLARAQKENFTVDGAQAVKAKGAASRT